MPLPFRDALIIRYISPVSYTHLDVYKRQIENLAKEETKVVKQKREPKPNQYVSYEKQLNKKLGYPVSIKPKKLTISYKNEQELENLLEKLLK